jgi:HlyD family secretion protein
MQGATRAKIDFAKILSGRSAILAGLMLAGMVGVTAYGLRQHTISQPKPPTPTVTPSVQTITALGRLAPMGEVIRLSSPSSTQGNRVDRLLVQEGDPVRAGQVVAILDSYDQLNTALAEANARVKVAQAKLAITQAGARQGEIAAQRAEIARLEADYQGNIQTQAAAVARLLATLRNAQAEFNRYRALHQQGAISASERDSKQLAVDTAQKSLQEAQMTLARLGSTRQQDLSKAKANLARIAEVRPVEVQANQAEVEQAIAARNQAKAALAKALVRTPIAGEILYVHTRSGEVVSSDGIVEIGQTRQMQAIAEVYQSDIDQIRVGQQVRVTSTAMADQLTGTVRRVGSQVRRQTVVNTDPSANIDARVIEVHITLDTASSRKAAKLTNLQVQVVIQK